MILRWYPTAALALLAAVLAAFLGLASETTPPRLAYPPARLDDTVEEIHGVAVRDPYRWLEDLGSEETLRWIKAQDALLEGYVRDVPGREPARRRILALSAPALSLTPVKAGGRYFSMRVKANGVPTG